MELEPLARLSEQFGKLPGIGRKTAVRLAYHCLNMPLEDTKKFADALLRAKEEIHRCSVCCDLTDQELCGICRAHNRDASTICIVEHPRDVLAIERTHEYHGHYHVLHGAISPLNGIGPEHLCLQELLRRLEQPDIKELILATNPTVEGEATAVYLARLLQPLGLATSRLAYGIPVGADLEYADEITLARALEGRRIFS